MDTPSSIPSHITDNGLTATAIAALRHGINSSPTPTPLAETTVAIINFTDSILPQEKLSRDEKLQLTILVTEIEIFFLKYT